MILAVAEDRIKQGFVHIARVADEQFAHIEQLQIDKNKYTGIETGFGEDLDRMTAGLQRGELIIIAARPSMGKTALSLNIAQNAATRMHYHGARRRNILARNEQGAAGSTVVMRSGRMMLTSSVRKHHIDGRVAQAWGRGWRAE